MAGTLEQLSVTIANHLVADRRWTVFEVRFAPSGDLEALTHLVVNLPHRDAIGDVALGDNPHVELFASPARPTADGQGLVCQAEWRDRVLTVAMPVALPVPPPDSPHVLWVYTDRRDYYLPYTVHVGVATAEPDGRIAHIGACGLEVADAGLTLSHLALIPDTVGASSALTLTLSTVDPLRSGSEIRITFDEQPGADAATDPSHRVNLSGDLQLSPDLPGGTSVAARDDELVLTLTEPSAGGTDLTFQISGLANPTASTTLVCAVRIFSGTVLLGEALTWRGKSGPPIEIPVLPPPLEGVRVVVADSQDGVTTSVTVSFRSPVPIPTSAGIAFLLLNDTQGDHPVTVVKQNFPASAEVSLKKPRDPIHGKTAVRVVLTPTADLPAGEMLQFTVSGLVLKWAHQRAQVGAPRELAPELANEIRGREREAVILISTEIRESVETLLGGPLLPHPRRLVKPAVFEVPAPL